MISKNYINDLRQRTRVSHTLTDGEINDLAEAARIELILAGVKIEKATDEKDFLIKAAISAYVKANYGFDAPDADKLREVFEKLIVKLTLSSDYID